LVYRQLHVFMDTNILVNIIYSITLSRIKQSKPPRILGMLENKYLIIYTDSAVINELINKALPNVLNSVDRNRHGWGNVDVHDMLNLCHETLKELKKKGYVRVIEDDKALRKQYNALLHRRGRRICWRDEIKDEIKRKVSSESLSEDLEVLYSLLLAYDVLATVPRSNVGITRGPLPFVTDDKKLRDFIQKYLVCSKCPCSELIYVRNYEEFKDEIKKMLS